MERHQLLVVESESKGADISEFERKRKARMASRGRERRTSGRRLVADSHPLLPFGKTFMKTIYFTKHPLFWIIFGIIFIIIGLIGLVLSGARPSVLVLSGCSGAFAITLFLVYQTTQEQIAKLLITPQKITIISTKGKETNINTQEIDTLTITITKQLGNSIAANTFPYQIEISFREKSGFQNYFCIKKEDYNIAFQLYDAFLNVVPHIHIIPKGQHANVIQTDIDHYFLYQKRVSWLTRFWSSCSKKDCIGLILFFSIIFFPTVALILVLVVKYRL